MQEVNVMVTEIIDKAEKAAKSIIESAEALKTEKLNEVKASQERIFCESIALAKKDAENIVSRRLVLAKLDGRKEELKAKQSVLENVYDTVISKILNMTDNIYREFIEQLIVKYAENGDKVVLNERDSKRVSEDFINKIGKKMNIHLSLSFDKHNSRGGIILSGKNCDKNLTLETIVKLLRNETESKVAKRLFA